MSTSGTPGWDRNAALERFGGDEQLLRELIVLFLEDADRLMQGLRSAIAAGDANALERAAHAFKGSVANFAVESPMKAAFKLETIGRSGDMTGAQDAFMTLEREYLLLARGMNEELRETQ